jgi:hypothetical protein
MARTTVKIGEFVRAYILQVFDRCDADELTKLFDRKYSKEKLGINFPFCAELPNIVPARYWSHVYRVQGKNVRVCNDWYESSRNLFSCYLASRGIETLENVTAPIPDHSWIGGSQTTESPKAEGWPEWNLPDKEQLFRLARITTPYIRFLHPDIVRTVVEDNERHRDKWCERLQGRGIDPALYLWEGSACAFPGVRRHTGSTEIAQYRGRLRTDDGLHDALALDDNKYPKQIWSFVLRARQFQNHGPVGYSLAHLIDHKKYKNRHEEELINSGTNGWPMPLGLYTSITNAVYIPESLARPTDFSSAIRNIIQRKAASLCSGFCRLLPPHLSLRTDAPGMLPFDSFNWHESVGTLDNIQSFLKFREREMEKLFLDGRNRAAQQVAEKGGRTEQETPVAPPSESVVFPCDHAKISPSRLIDARVRSTGRPGH